MSLPIVSLGICPAIISTLELEEYAVDNPAAALYKPGPGTTIATPIPLLALA